MKTLKQQSGRTADALPEAATNHASRNFLVMVVYQIVMRTGWIFKAESIIMPAVLDSIGGPAWLRGCLPMLNRIGHSVPPLLVAHRIKGVSRKKWVLAGCTLLNAITILALAAAFYFAGSERNNVTMQVTFLVLYAAFFCSIGINQLTFAALQGKLVRVSLRGRLMLASNVIGAGTAIFCVWMLLPRWLTPDGGNFDCIFGFAGACFAVCALCCVFLAEHADRFPCERETVRHRIWTLWQPLHEDRNFRRLAVIAAMFGVSIMLFPHYQALARERLGLDMRNLVTWVIIQNVGTALFSLVGGPLADSRGNRLVLRIVMAGVCLAPLTAIALSYVGSREEYRSIAGMLFPVVFVLVGMTPVVIRMFQNYTLEIAAREDHPRYLSALGLCMAVPIYFSPLLGWLLDCTGFEPVFLSVCGIVLLAWLGTFRLAEPRQHILSDSASPPISVDT